MTAYYNEIDPYAAQWLRNLIDAGLIAPGDVDERSIVDVQPEDLEGYTQCHFFAGIAGWSQALRLAGWPDDRPVWTGSCPCQPFSAAGKGAGANDTRHLWPEFFRLIEACRPRTIFGEQVASALGRQWLCGEGEVVPFMWERETFFGILQELQGADSQYVQVVRQIGGTREEAGQPPENIGELFDVEAEETGARTGECSQASGEESGFGIQSGPGGNSGGDRRGALSGNGPAVRSGYPQSVERPLSGSNKSIGWLHERQRSGGSLRPECNGEYVGPPESGGDSKRHHGEAAAKFSGTSRETDIRIEAASEHKRLTGVRADLETVGYACGAADLCAAGVGAPHIRQRLWWVGNAASGGRHEKHSLAGGGDQRGEAEGRQQRPWSNSGLIFCADGKERRVEPGICPLVDGLSDYLGELRSIENIAWRRIEEYGHASEINPDKILRMVQRAIQSEASWQEQSIGMRGKLHEPQVLFDFLLCVDAARGETQDRSGFEKTGYEIRRRIVRGMRAHGGVSGSPRKRQPDGQCNGEPTNPLLSLSFILARDAEAHRGAARKAHAVSSRVNQLRAYGNAIVPQVAAEFISASMEAIQ